MALKEEIISPPPSPKNEIVKVDDVVSDVKTLGTLVAILLTQTDNIEKYSITISPELKNALNKLVKYTDFFSNVEQLFVDIVKDNKIDAKDVPKIMLLITDLSLKLKETKIDFNEELCGNILKLLFNIVVEEELIKVDKEDLELLKCLYDIIDTSMRLLQTDVSEEKRGLIYCLKKTGKKYLRCKLFHIWW
jgi:hypothetical protein